VGPFFKLLMYAGTYKARVAINKIQNRALEEKLAERHTDGTVSDLKASVVICTHNRANLLKESVEAILRQDFPRTDLEIIVVNNNSTDNTCEVTEGLAATSPVRFTYVFEQEQGLSHARNAGIRRAAGEIVIFVDDDIDAEVGWLKNLVEAFNDPAVGGAGGPIRPIWPFERPDWLNDRWLGFLTISEFTHARETGKFMGPCNFPWGANMAFRRNVFDEAGMFPVDLGRVGGCLLSSEEVGLFRRIDAGGKRISFVPDAVILHKIAPERLTRQWFYHRTYWQGRSNAVMNTGDVKNIQKQLVDCLTALVYFELGEDIPAFDRRCKTRETTGYLAQLLLPQQEEDRMLRYRRLKVVRLTLKYLVSKSAQIVNQRLNDAKKESIARINELTTVIESTEALLQQKNDECVAIETVLQQKNDECEALEAALQQRSVESKLQELTLQQIIEQQNQESAAKDDIIRQQEERITGLLNSMSWKITYPVRRIYDVVKRQ